jgi:hypothetical protein
MRILTAIRRLWNGGVYGDQHKLTLVEPQGLAEWFTRPYGGHSFLSPFAGRGEMDAVPVWLGWPKAPWNVRQGPWSEWSSGQLAGCIIRHLRGDHEPKQFLMCPLCKEAPDAST